MQCKCKENSFAPLRRVVHHVIRVFFTFTPPPPTLLEIRAKSQINEFIFVARFHCALFRRRTFPKISGHFHLLPKERTKKQCSGKRRGGEFNLCSSCAASLKSEILGTELGIFPNFVSSKVLLLQ